MPQVVLVSFSGLRVRSKALAEVGARLPSLSDRAAAIAELPALGLLTLAGATPSHWEVRYREVSDGADALLEELLASPPDLVGISALTASILDAYAFSDRLRAEGISTVLGGLHVTACPDEAQRHATSIVIGDGEFAWPELLEDATEGKLQPRYQKMGALDDTPLPRFELIARPVRPRWTLQTERGCPLSCEFCGASRLLGPYRTKSVTRVAKELRSIKELGGRTLELADDNSFLRPDTIDLLDALEASGLRYFTEADWRIGEKPELVERLASSGCVQLLVGIESLVFRHPGMGGKMAPLERVMDAVEAIQEAGVVVNGCFIVGSDGETRHSMARLTEFIVKSPLAEVQVTLETPFPGTAHRARLKKAGRLLDRDWSHYTLFDVTQQPDQISVEELEQGFWEALETIHAPAPSRTRKQRRREIWRSKEDSWSSS